MRARRVLALASILLAAACGLSAVGEMVVEPPQDAGTERTLPVLPEAGDFDASSGDADAEAGFDAQPLCLQVCDGGGCDAGWCTFDCADGGGACATRVVCPPGVPCAVECGTGGCTQGVDCTQAMACAIDCTGAGSCINQDIECAGSSCDVTCAAGACTAGIKCDAGTCNVQCKGNGSCINQPVECSSAGACTLACRGDNSCTNGVTCDAGSCRIRCSGTGSCINQNVGCNAVSTCAIQCGTDAGGGQGKSSCTNGVTCNAGASCEVTCSSDDTCTNQPVRATAPNVDVGCLDNNACAAGPIVSGGDASITCRRGGSCGSTITCDAGKCFASCLSPEDPQSVLCCANAGSATCQLDASQCDPAKFKLGCP